MSEPRRLLDEWEDDFGRDVLRSAKLDAPPRGATKRATVVITAAIATGAAATSAPAAAATALLKTIGTMTFFGVAAVGAAVYLEDARTAPAPSATPETTSVARATSSARARSAHAASVQAAPTTPPEAPPPSAALAASAAPSATTPSMTPSPALPPAISAPAALAATTTPAASASASPSPSASPAPSVSSESALASELAAIDLARRTLASGDPRRALGLLDDYAVRFPRGVLSAEATVLRIEALLRAGDRAAAQRLGARFLAANPTSAYVPRVQSLLGKSDAAVEP
jgi:hypothetical protein